MEHFQKPANGLAWRFEWRSLSGVIVTHRVSWATLHTKSIIHQIRVAMRSHHGKTEFGSAKWQNARTRAPIIRVFFRFLSLGFGCATF